MSQSSRRSGRTAAEDPLAAHLQRTASWSLLTAAEEVALSRAIEVGVLARERLESDGRASADDLAVLVAQGERAMARMVAANLRLVLMVARGHRTPGVSLLDLVQEGTLGLIRAVQRFDHQRGLKFSTYAVWWIRQAVQRGSAELLRAVRLPVATSEQLRMVRAARHRLEFETERDVTVAELAEATGLSLPRVRHLLSVDREVVHLDAPRPGDDPLHSQLSLPDVLADLSTRAVTSTRVHDALVALQPQERRVLERRYGLVGPGLSAAQVGARLGLSESQVRRLERRALERLREHPALHAVVA
jgi:RNA polymerase sigma factor (sigma-70 family)